MQDFSPHGGISAPSSANPQTTGKETKMHFQGVPERLGQALSTTIYEAEQQYVAPGLQEVSQLSRLVIKQGRGCRLIDV